MAKQRIISEVATPEDAKKVEETVKTGYTETSIENLVNWAAVEEDLEESYGQLAERAESPERKEVFKRLQAESKRNMVELSGLVEYLEGLDRARVKRIELLSGLQP
jgi:rubrerythrin